MIKEHWQNIYKNKGDNEVSWTQAYPNSLVDYLSKMNLSRSARMIDVGGGASKFADVALDHGFTDITVLDISDAGLQRSKKRLGDKAAEVRWIVSDINDFVPSHPFEFWYDRAVFHFLTRTDEIERYVELVHNSLTPEGRFLLGTFSENGPKKCSGLEIRQYSESKMIDTFSSGFACINSYKEIHTTPFGTMQEFQFCEFVKR